MVSYTTDPPKLMLVTGFHMNFKSWSLICRNCTLVTWSGTIWALTGITDARLSLGSSKVFNTKAVTFWWLMNFPGKGRRLGRLSRKSSNDIQESFSPTVSHSSLLSTNCSLLKSSSIPLTVGISRSLVKVTSPLMKSGGGHKFNFWRKCSRMKWNDLTWLRQAFLAPPAEKTKTQGQNSSKKLKKKTQEKNSTFGRTFPPICKTQEKN